MRGNQPIEFLSPVRGVIANLPIHKVGPDALVNGNNVYVDIDGLLKTRQGYTPVASAMAVTERVQGLISYLDISQNFVQLSGGATTWQLFNGTSWVNITGTPLTTAANDFVEFVNFEQSGQEWIYGVNNANTLKGWNSTLPAYIDIAGAASVFTAARDIDSLANRVVVVSTTESGAISHQRVRWSAFNDGSTWPALAFADLIDESTRIIGIKRTSRLSAVIYREFSAWLMNAQAGDDANAFTFQRIPTSDTMVGPVSTACIVSAEGAHYYLGTDGRIYIYDGISIYPISAAVDPLVIPNFNTGFASRAHSCYLPAKRMVIFFMPTGSNQDPFTAIPYSIANQCFYPPFTFSEAITASATVQSSTGPTWLNWVSPSTTWPTVPYTSWSSIPLANQLLMWTGTLAGNVHNFFSSINDNGFIIPYNATYGLIRFDPTQTLRTDFLEVYLQQGIMPEALEVDILGWQQPLYSTSTPLWSLAINLADQTTFFAKASPGPHHPANLKTNFVQLVLSSAGYQAQLIFAGAVILTYPDQRYDYGTLQ